MEGGVLYCIVRCKDRKRRGTDTCVLIQNITADTKQKLNSSVRSEVKVKL